MVKQITIDKPTKPNLFAPDDALITTSTTAVDFVTDDLEKLAVELISNNELRIKSGVFCIGGHYGYVPNGTYETCYVAPGNVGFRRKDLIVARYTRIGNLDYIGIQIYTGVPSKGEPVVPTYTVSDLNTGGKIREIALYTVELVDMNIVSVEQMFGLLTPVVNIAKESYFTTQVAGILQHQAKLEINGVVTETCKFSLSRSYTTGKDGVFAGLDTSFSIELEPGYSASDIVVIPSVMGTDILKLQIELVAVSDYNNRKRIYIGVTPYSYVFKDTEITSDFSVYVRYKKVKL